MAAPINLFKQKLQQRIPQIGLWLAMANNYCAEMTAGAGFDWLVLDAEHAPNNLTSLWPQLQALKGSASHGVVRPPIGETWMIKQILDIGAQTLLIPMVETADAAKEYARAVRYPPHGIRGVGAGLARASDFNRTADYLKTANDQICLLLQIESRAGLEALNDIAAVEGIDGIFIGPADLAADMGYLGAPEADAVKAAIDDAIKRICGHNLAAGILTSNTTLAKHYLELGATFVAVGSDVGVFAGALKKLRQKFF